jgi:hypothetical protein
VVVIAFAVGINYIYEPYNGGRFFDVNGTVEQLNALRSFVHFSQLKKHCVSATLLE